MEEKKLLSCKKCGSGFARVVYSILGKVAISCLKCSYCTKYKPTKEEAINAWNQRNRQQCFGNVNEKEKNREESSNT